MSYFHDSFTACTTNRDSVRELISELFESGLFPKTVTRYGFTVDVEAEVPKFITDATDQQIDTGVRVIEAWVEKRKNRSR